MSFSEIACPPQADRRTRKQKIKEQNEKCNPPVAERKASAGIKAKSKMENAKMWKSSAEGGFRYFDLCFLPFDLVRGFRYLDV